MKFLADEGIDKKLVTKLRTLGFDVEYVAESKFGTQDKVILTIPKPLTFVLSP